MSDSEEDRRKERNGETRERVERSAVGSGGGGGSGLYNGPVDEKMAEYVHQLMKEKKSLDPDQYPLIFGLIQKEMDKLTKGDTSIDGVQETQYIDLYNDTPISLNVKAVPPTKSFPKFNYAGRIIGPRGAYLKAIMKETMCKMVLLGKGVLKDKEKEDELRESLDPKYYHLHEDMHIALQVTAPPAEAYARLAYAITCLKQQVLSDTRTLEGLSWIINAHRILEGGTLPQDDKYTRYNSRGHNSASSSSTPAYSRHSTYNSSTRSPPYDMKYDYSDHHAASAHGHSDPYRHPYQRDPSPDRSARKTTRISDVRAIELIDKARLTAYSRGGTSSGSSSKAYDYYDSMPESSYDPYNPYPQSSYKSAVHPIKSWTTSSHSHSAPRYAPYKK